MLLPPVIGHRGVAGLAPENTLASFRRAAALGLTMVEFDVRLSSDAQPVVFHDDGLERTSNGRGLVAEWTLDRLKQLDAGAWFGAEFAGEPIATLDEVLLLCRELGLGANLEIKPDHRRKAETARIALDRANALWRGCSEVLLISSFEGACLEVARDRAPQWPRGLLVEAVPEDWRDRAVAYGCATVHADHRHLDRTVVAEIRETGRPVLAYTVNDGDRARALRELGVSSVFSDRPQM